MQERQLPQTSAFVVARVKICLTSSLITVQNLVAVFHTGCTHVVVGSQSLVTLPPTPLDTGAWLTQWKVNTLLPKRVIIPNFVALGQTVLAYIRGNKILGDAGSPPPWDEGVADP